jgi:hypothetical protein
MCEKMISLFLLYFQIFLFLVASDFLLYESPKNAGFISLLSKKKGGGDLPRSHQLGINSISLPRKLQ